MMPLRLIFLSIVVLLLNGCGDSSSKPEESPNASDGAVTTGKDIDFAHAIYLRNRGLGHLENKEWSDAEKLLKELAELLPDNTVAQRNLAVSRVLSLVDRESPFSRSGGPQKAQQFNDAVAAAEDAIRSFRQIATKNYDNALADLLEGRLRIHATDPVTGGIDDGLALLKRAASAATESPDFRFAVAMAMDGDREYSDARSPKSAELLKQLLLVFEMTPKNLFVLQKLLQRQALFLRSEIPETKELAQQLPKTLKAAIPLLQPFNESIKKQRRLDLIDTISKALESFDSAQPASLMQPAMVTANLLLPEIATQIDQRRINRNLLEYVAWSFDEDFRAAAADAGAIPTPEPTVLNGFITSDIVPELTGVTDVEFQDMNLDGFDDLTVVRDGVLEIYSRGTDVNAPWQLVTSYSSDDATLTDILLVDLNRDYDRVISDVKSPVLLRDADGDQKIATDPAGVNRWYDADLDVVAWNKEQIIILQNNVAEDGTRSLKLVPQNPKVTQINDVAAADLDMDGDLDLAFATESGIRLWRSLDGLTFESMNDSANLPTDGISTLRIGNFNSDPAIDILGFHQSNEEMKAGVLENLLHGRFRWQEAEDISEGLATARLSLTGEIRADFDNDARIDLLQIHESKSQLLRGTGSGFEAFALDLPKLSVATAGDFDDDGDLDICGVLADSGELTVLLNDGGNANNWIDVVARAVPDDPQFPSNRVNMHAIGSTIELKVNGLSYSKIIDEPRTHIGLGKAESADVIRILWTDGIPQDITSDKLLRGRIGILAPQILKGSCPYIYTWTGERFEFFSDCLWAAPLGLVQASGELAPTREWENLLIRGEALVEKDGKYVLQLTEELWETAYFDQVELTTIDHPEDVQIFTNEKVGPPSMAAHRVHTVRNRQTPKSIVDGRGRNLLPGLSQRDGNYVQAFEGRILQGLTDEWVMEFDLGQIPDTADIRLFLTGWIFPTDTSLNLAINQNPNLTQPVPPSIDVPDGQGGWKNARPFIGFPSGKTKAMVVDITDIFSGDDYRFRLRSSMELYWDEVFFTAGERDAEVMVQPCVLESADLHFRGFSRRTYADNALFRSGHAPESYDYSSPTTMPRWPTISGRFTRYGDTTPLVLAHDDRLVVMGPGDELTLSFTAPDASVPDGWKRDFVLRNVGFDKDADLNTIYGQSSEPFPFRGMTSYPFGPNEGPESPEEFQKHIDEWQTREYSQPAGRQRFISP